MSTTVTFDPSWGPKVTLMVNDAGDIEATIEVAELEPTRDTTTEERAAGITSLDPPTISIRALASRYDTCRAAIEAASRAVAASAEMTDGFAGATPGELTMMHQRVTATMREALRKADEDV